MTDRVLKTFGDSLLWSTFFSKITQVHGGSLISYQVMLAGGGEGYHPSFTK